MNDTTTIFAERQLEAMRRHFHYQALPHRCARSICQRCLDEEGPAR